MNNQNEKPRNFPVVNREVFTGLRKKVPKSRQNGEFPNVTLINCHLSKTLLLLLYTDSYSRMERLWIAKFFNFSQVRIRPSFTESKRGFTKLI